MKLFAVKDMKAQVFLRPHFAAHTADELRSWEVASNDSGDSMISKFPNDYRLFEMGQFDITNGSMSLYDHAVDHGSAADFKKQPPQNALPFPPQSV